MAEVPNPKWYDEGTVALTQGSPAVTGTGTFWVSAGVKVGDIFVDANGMIYEITAVNDSTSLTLGKNYTGATGSGKGYSIIRVFNSTMNSTLANRIATLMSEFEQRYDLDMQTITPKNAYDIAKDNGFTGTESDWLTSLNAYGIAKSNGFTGTQAEWLASLNAYGVAVSQGYTGTIEEWLEGLKAAGEWENASGRLSRLEGFIKIGKNVGSHNQIYRGKNLGTQITDAQRTAIQSDDWSNLCIGDYWTINGHIYIIVKFISHIYGSTNMGIMIMAQQIKQGQDVIMNETATNEGGYYNSYMHNTYLPEVVLPIIQADWGDLMCMFYDRFPSTNASSLSLGCNNFPLAMPKNTKFYLMLPTYIMYKGYPYPPYPQNIENLHAAGQLPYFRFADCYAFQEKFLGWVQDCADDTSKFLHVRDAFDNQIHGVVANEYFVSSWRPSTNYISPLFMVS